MSILTEKLLNGGPYFAILDILKIQATVLLVVGIYSDCLSYNLFNVTETLKKPKGIFQFSS